MKKTSISPNLHFGGFDEILRHWIDFLLHPPLRTGEGVGGEEMSFDTKIRPVRHNFYEKRV